MDSVRLAFSVDDTKPSLGALVSRLGARPALENTLHIDLTECQYLGPMAVSVIGSLVQARSANSLTTLVSPPSKEVLASYCVYSGLAELAGFGPAPTAHPANETIPLHTFAHRANDGAQGVVGLVRKHMTANEHAAQVLFTIIGEISQNVCDHAQAPGVLTAKFLVGKSRIRVCVCDSGIGLRQSLASRHTVDSDLTAVRLAMTADTTSASRPYNRGQGLDLLDKLISHNGGRLLLVSGSAYYERSGERRSSGMLRLGALSGTLCFVEFVVDNELYPDEESDSDVW